MSKRSHSVFLGDGSGGGQAELAHQATPDVEAQLTKLVDALTDVNNFQIWLKKLKKQRLIDGEGEKSDAARGMEARLVEYSKMLVPLLPAISSVAEVQVESRKGEDDAQLELDQRALPEQLQDARFDKKFAQAQLNVAETKPSLLSSLSPGLVVPSPFTASPMTASDVPDELPPLPTILDPSLEQAVFTHKGRGTATSPDYERLEWLGDAYLHIISTLVIFQSFGASQEGDLSYFREILGRNSTLTGYSRLYHFDQRIKLPLDMQRKETHKIWGDVFEAYVGAVILSDPADGLQRATRWLKALWAKSLERQLKTLSKDTKKAQDRADAGAGPALLAKERLSAALVVKGVSLSYEPRETVRHDRDNPKIQLFMVDVFLIGWGKRTFLGSGTGKSMADAREKAAEAALSNKKLMKVYEDKKAAYMASLDEA